VDDTSISYEMLQDLLRAERRSNRLSPVQPRFWAKVRTFLEEVLTAFRAEQEKDPFSRKAMMLRDEAQHAKQAAEGLWALRERKMSIFALAQVKNADPDKPGGITRLEEELYDAILATMKAGRARVFDGVISAPVPALAKPSPKVEAEAAMPRAPASAADPERAPRRAAEEAPEPIVVPSDTPEQTMVTIRATADIPPFVGPDMQTYLLKEGDVAMVPPAIANLLARRGKAETIDA
jgi:DNA replication initiation complex subunit (GINS family)